jgi:adenine-specific DNA-methyltransferase
VLKALFGDVVFSNPKDHEVLADLISYCLQGSRKGVILDFFAGSCSTAHAVQVLNTSDGGERQFIMVQLPEVIDPELATSPAAKQIAKRACSFLDSRGLPHTIAEIGKERIRRTASVERGSFPMFAGDLGFRVLKIDTSNMRDVYYAPDATTQASLLEQVDNIRPDRIPEDLLFQLLVDWGLELSLPIAEETIAGKRVFFVDGNALAACFDTEISEELVKQLAKRKPLRAVFRDASFTSDSVKINVDQIFKLLSPETEVRSI